MKNNLKKIKILLLLLTAVFYSCDKDLYEEVFKPVINQKANVRTSTLKEIFKDKDFVLAYKKIPKKNTSSSSEFCRSTFEENNGFTIIDETVRVVETDNLTTYTLLIESDDNTEGKLENLVLFSELQDGELGYIIEYNSLSDLGLTEEEIIQNGIKNVDGILTDVNSTSKVVFYHYWVGHCIVASTHFQFCDGIQGNQFFMPGQCGHWESGYIFVDEDGGNSGGVGTVETVEDGIGGSSSGISTSPVTLTLEELEYKDFKKNTLTVIQNNWLIAQNIQNSNVGISIMNYLSLNDYDATSTGFIVDMINYLIQNQSISYEQYVNWFSLQQPGIEDVTSYDSAFWDNPSLNFPQQQLPTYAIFKQNFPGQNITAQQLCTSIGGGILTLYNNVLATGNHLNTCAIRLSKALNDSGNIIPFIPGKTKAGILNGTNTKYYFTFAADANAWMLEVFGSNITVGIGPQNDNHVRYTYQELQPYINPTNGNVLNPNNPIGNLQGIFSMISTNPAWSTGHCDLLQPNNTCINSCHFEGPIQHIDIWILN